jgi:hypothetical protein
MRFFTTITLYFFFISFTFAQTTEAVLDSILPKKSREDLIIFVNGFWGNRKMSPAKCARECYWQYDSIIFKPKNTWNYNQQECEAFFQEAYLFFKTKNVFFVDGGHFSPAATARRRQRRGRKFADNQLDSIISKFHLTDSSKAHFVTHSMGGAFAEGMIQRILASRKIHVGKVLHLSISEAEDIKTERTVLGPEQRIQVISQSDAVVEKVNRLHWYRKENVSKIMSNCDLFACFYENEVTRPQAGDIGHALHLRSFVFTIIKDLQSLDIQSVEAEHRLKNTSNKVPYYKVKKEGCCVEYNGKEKCFKEKIIKN